MVELVVGITGPICAGKNVAAKIFSEKLGAKVFSFGDEARAETKKQEKELTRENIRATAKETQEKLGRDVWAQRLIEKIMFSKADHVVAEGFRVMPEVEVFRKQFGKSFVLVAVTAPFETRFQRAHARAREKEPVDEKGFKELDDLERGVGEGNGYKYEFDACVRAADKQVENNSTFEELEKKIAALTKEIG